MTLTEEQIAKLYDEAAFPLPDAASYQYSGMSVRDWLAGQALAGLLAHASGEDPHKAPELAFSLADMMLHLRCLPRKNPNAE